MLSNKLMMVLVLALGGAAMAQDADPMGKAMEGAPPSGQRTGQLRVPEVPGQAPAAQDRRTQAALDQLAKDVGARPVQVAQGAGADPVPLGAEPQAAPQGRPVAPAAVAPLPAGLPQQQGGVGPAGSSPDAPDDSAEISANYNVTEEIYTKILEAQGQNTDGIDKRIASNQDIKNRYRPELVKNEDQMRRLQVDFMNRAFQLKQQKDAGQLSEEAYKRAIEAEQAKADRRKGAIVGDLQFYKEEMTQADVRLAELGGQKRTIEDRVARENAGKPKKKNPSEALFEGFNGTLDKLSAFHTSFTMDGDNAGVRCTEPKNDEKK